MLCYQAFVTPSLWGVIALTEGRPVGAGLVEGWRTQPFLVESVLVALFSAAAMVAGLSVERLRAQRRRLEHINNVLLGIRNVNQLIVTEDDPERLIERACVNLTETMGYLNAWIALLGGEPGRALGLSGQGAITAAASAGFEGGFEAIREQLERGEFPICMKRALESEVPIVSVDPASDCPDCPLSGNYGGRAALARRLAFDGVTYGILTASTPANYAHDVQEQDFFNEVAGDLAFALHKIATGRRLEDNRQRLGLVVEGSGIGTWEWNVQTNETVFNDYWAQMLEYRPDEVEPTVDFFKQHVHPEDLEAVLDRLTGHVEGRLPVYESEHRFWTKSGRWLRVMDRGKVAERDKDGRPVRVTGIIADITERKQAEEALARQLRFEQAVAEASKRLVSAEASESVVADALTPVLEATGVSRVYIFKNYDDPNDGLCMNQVYEVCAPGIAPEIDNPVLQHVIYSQGFERWRKILSAGEAIRGDVCDFPDNEREILESQEIISLLVLPLIVEGRWWGFIGFDETRRPRDWQDSEVALLRTAAEMLGAYFMRKRAEEALNREHEMLVRTEAAAHVGSWEWETEGDNVTWSDELFRIFGLEPADEAPPFAEHQAFYVPEDRARLAQAVEECVTNGAPYDLEVRVTRSDGALRHCIVRGFPERDADGVVKRLYGSLQDITEIRRAEERIDTLSCMLDDAPVSITIHDTEGRFIFANAATASMHGYESMEEFMEVNLHEPDVPESESVIADRMREIAEEGEARFEVEHYRKDGSTFPLAVLAKRIEWEGRPAILSIAADITERRQAEALVAASEEKFRRAFMTSPDSININRLSDGRYIEVNDGFLRIMGYEREEVIGRTSLELNIWKNPEDRKNLIKGLQADGYVENLSAQFCRADGTVREGLMSACVVELNGEQCILSITRDVTERVKAEEALRDSQELFRLAFDTKNVAWALSRQSDGVYLSANPGFLEITGYPSDELIGHSSRELNFFSEESRRDMLERIQQYGYLHHEELTFRTKQGEWRTILFSISPMTVKGEKCLSATMIDITDLKQAEAERENLQSQLTQAQKMESVGRLAGGVAHDFNNMLNVILGHADLMLDDLSEDNPLRDDLEEIHKAAERSANLTRQLLAFARRQTVAPKVLDLNETIASMLKMLERLIGEDIDLLWKPGTRLDLVHIDPGQVDQILANLAVNARDAIGHANGKVTIETANVCFDEEYCAAHAGFLPGAYVMLAVSDDGSGMDKETRAQIFEPFFTTKSTGQGTGLGLATIYGIVKQNNGFVNVYSEPGKGATFRIYLPALEADSRRQRDARTADVPAVGGNETILIVEDDAAILNLTRMTLERFGYTVLTAGTPTEALRTAREQQGKIDLLITDVVMPEMNGRDMARSLRECCPNIRSLFMSGYTANVIAHHGVLEEGVNFIQKPFSSRDLAKKVREALEK